MNGAPLPLRGSQDMDGEVLAAVSTQAGRAERTVGVMNREAAMPASATNPKRRWGPRLRRPHQASLQL